nr:hypothetical protein BaRGS_021768 [Batillaria attramentaria]
MRSRTKGADPAKESVTDEKDSEAETVIIETGKGLELKRTVGLVGAISFTVGTMIGSGIFITPTSVLRNTGSVALNLIVWSLGGVLSLLGSFTVAELACRAPHHGGFYAYLRLGFGNWMGFVYTWKAILFDYPSSLAVKSLTFSRYLVSVLNFCGTPELPVQMIAITLIVTLCIVCVTSNRLSVAVNVTFLYAKLLAMAMIIVGGVYALASGNTGDSEISTGFDGTLESPATIAKSIYFVMYAYGGWQHANTLVEEVKKPKRNVPLASIVGVLLVTVVYVMTNVSYLAAMSRDQMLAADTVAVTWGRNVLGHGVASLIIPLCVMASTMGSANSGLFGAPRIVFASARDGNLPEVLSYIHVRSRTPIPAIFVVTGMAIFYAVASNIVTLISLLGLTDWTFYFLVSISLLIIRYRQRNDKNLDVPFKQPIAVIVLFMLLSLYLVVMPQIEGVTIDLLYAVVFLFIGLVVFFIFTCVKNRTTLCDGFVTTVQLLLQVGPTVPFALSD